MIVKMAWRNLWRHTRRTLLTVSTVALGLALLLLSLGLGDGSHQQMIDSAVRLGAGHVLLQQPGYQERAEIDQVLFPDQVEAIRGWIESQEEIEHWVRRVFASGLASSADGSSGVQILGIQPREEAEASWFDEKVEAGAFLDETDEDVAVLGEGLAQKLELGLGDKLVLMAQAAHSSEIQSKLVRVKGILRTGLEAFDQTLVLIPLKTAQTFLGLGHSVHQVALFCRRESLAAGLAGRGQERFPELEVLHWSDALPELRDYIRIDDGGNYVFNLFIFFLVAFTVMNTLLMSVLERGREFALLDALGLTPSRRFILVLLEATFVALLSVAAGCLLGYSGHLYFHLYGLPLDAFFAGEVAAAGVVLDPILYSELSPGRILGSALLVLLLTLLLAFLPALRAARPGDVRLLENQ